MARFLQRMARCHDTAGTRRSCGERAMRMVLEHSREHERRRPTASGWPTWPTSGPSPVGSTSPSSLTSFRATWSAGRSPSLVADLAVDALEMAIWARRSESLDGLIHHSDRGGQYLAIRYLPERLAEAGAVTLVG